ncbi:MAG TPA: ester cyclase [Dehalococcoidia bacterium]|nr:ester cyclase [Dehalococcoidia bacterium]
MTEDRNMTVVRDLNRAENAHDLDGIFALMHEDVVWESNVLPTPVVGREADRQINEALFRAFPDYHREIEQLIASGDYVVMRWRMTGTHRGEWNAVPATNRPIDVHGCTVFEIRDGKEAHAWLYMDSDTFMRQLGVSPPVTR